MQLHTLLSRMGKYEQQKSESHLLYIHDGCLTTLVSHLAPSGVVFVRTLADVVLNCAILIYSLASSVWVLLICR